MDPMAFDIGGDRVDTGNASPRSTRATPALMPAYNELDLSTPLVTQ